MKNKMNVPFSAERSAALRMMLRPFFALSLGLSMPVGAHADESNCTFAQLESLPEWSRGAQAVPSAYRISCSVNPFYQRGDFDGDGQADLAVLIVEATTGKRGVAVIHRANAAVFILGAGKALGNGGDDFRWLDAWSVEPAPRKPNEWKAPLPNFRAEGLMLQKSESASGFVGWADGAYQWYQQGD